MKEKVTAFRHDEGRERIGEGAAARQKDSAAQHEEEDR